MWARSACQSGESLYGEIGMSWFGASGVGAGGRRPSPRSSLAAGARPHHRRPAHSAPMSAPRGPAPPHSRARMDRAVRDPSARMTFSKSAFAAGPPRSTSGAALEPERACACGARSGRRSAGSGPARGGGLARRGGGDEGGPDVSHGGYSLPLPRKAPSATATSRRASACESMEFDNT